MRALKKDELMLLGGETNCGDDLETAVVETTCTLAGALIGWGLSGGNPIGGVYGAKLGYTTCKIACHS